MVSGQWAVFSGRGVAGADLRGEVPLEAAVQSHGWAQMRGVFFATDEHGFSRMNRGGPSVLSFPLSLISLLWQGRHVPLTPDPSPPAGARGGICVFKWDWKARVAPLAPGRGEGLGVRVKFPWKVLC